MNLTKNIYFITKGERVGQFITLIEYIEQDKIYSVLGFPECEPFYLSHEDIQKGINSGILEYVEQLPTDTYEECKNEFNYRKNINN